ncbi:hypothetical protein [Mucilaginibacter antarcticus]|uniref:Uncharacterized protein n=1 Tax=Mucilaginibacter antarcticus TaxID=1855725 RepID=A0ABW5XNZ8_9SPHI
MSAKSLVTLLLIFIGHAVFAQSKKGTVRPPFTLSLRINDSIAFDQPFKETFYLVDEGVLQLFPGDDVLVEVDLEKDSLINFKIVPTIMNKEKTMRFTFFQSYEGNIHKEMILKVYNPFSKNLVYKAHISIINTDGWKSTSIAPVLPKLLSYELWPDIIGSILLQGFKLESAK